MNPHIAVALFIIGLSALAGAIALLTIDHIYNRQIRAREQAVEAQERQLRRRARQIAEHINQTLSDDTVEQVYQLEYVQAADLDDTLIRTPLLKQQGTE